MDFLKYKKSYFTFSAVLVAMGIYSIITWGFNLGIDFAGGVILEYQIPKEVTTDSLKETASIDGVEVSSVQKSEAGYILRAQTVNESQRAQIKNTLSSSFGEVEELRYEIVGPSIGTELVKKTLYAIVIASVAILLWVAIQFKSIKYGVSAVLAMFHDTFILVGSFSLLGHLSGVEIDFLFVTALLTTLSFSVHDTIVVFDRIREIHKKEGGELNEISNRALSETMVRSLNNSFTIIFMLTALILLGGATTKWFATALLIGTVLGTYSSPFVAVPLLVTWDSLTKK